LQGALIGLIVSVIIQIWIFLGSQIYRNEMRSFRLPTRIDGCAALRDNITLALNTTIYSNLWNETSNVTTIKTIVKYEFKIDFEELIKFDSFIVKKKSVDTVLWYELFLVYFIFNIHSIGC